MPDGVTTEPATASSLRHTADGFVETLRNRADEIEAARRLPADLAGDLARAGFFGMLIPEAFGGLEVSPQVFSSVLQTLATGDASAAWCAMIASTTGLNAAYLQADAARRVFAERRTITGGVFAPMGQAVICDGGYRVTGRWQWASGSANCDWMCGGAMLLRDGAPVMDDAGRPVARLMIMPREDVELIDTWHVSGLKGTGSGDMSVSDVFVPDNLTVSLQADRPTARGPLYVFPVFGLLALGVASVALGNARAALDGVRAQLQSKAEKNARVGSGRVMVQSDYAGAEALLASATAFLASAVDTNWTAARERGVLDVEDRAALRLACTHAVRTGADVTRIAFDLGGGASVFLENDLQRRFRDAHTMTQHMITAPATYELTGRVLLGVSTDTGLL